MSDIDVNKIQVQHQDMLEMQKNRIFKDTASVFADLQGDLFFVINGESSLKQQEIEIKKLIDETFSNINTDLSDELIDISYYESQFQNSLMTEAIAYGLKGELVKVGKELIETTIFRSPIEGVLFKDSLKSMSENLKQQTIRQVRIGVANGLPVRDIRNSVTAQLNSTARRYESFVRTAVQNSTNQAKDLTYQKNKKFIKGIQIVAIMDKRTTDICKSYNLNIYPVGEGPRPPFHYNCRTFTIAIFKDEDIISDGVVYRDYNTEGGYQLSTDEKGKFKPTTKTITIEKQKTTEEKSIGRKI